MRKMPLNQIAFGKTDAFNELNTFGQEYFMESFVANPKYHIDDFLSGSRFFVCGKKGTGKSALLKYLECHFLKDESNLELTIRNYQKKYIRFFLNLNLFTLQYMC